MREIRVKKENLETILAALQSNGFVAEECQCPVSEAFAFRSHPGDDWDWDRERESADKQGMTGICTNASGNQAHKIIRRVVKQESELPVSKRS